MNTDSAIVTAKELLKRTGVGCENITLSQIDAHAKEMRAIVDEIKSIWEDKPVPEIYSCYVGGLMNLTAIDADSAFLDTAIEELEAAVSENGLAEYRDLYARGLCNYVANISEEDKAFAALGKLRALWEANKEPGIQLAYAQALAVHTKDNLNFSFDEAANVQKRTVLAWTEELLPHATESQAIITCARTLYYLCCGLSSCGEGMRPLELLKDLWTRTKMPEVGEVYARSLSFFSRIEDDLAKNFAFVDQIRMLWESFPKLKWQTRWQSIMAWVFFASS